MGNTVNDLIAKLQEMVEHGHGDCLVGLGFEGPEEQARWSGEAYLINSNPYGGYTPDRQPTIVLERDLSNGMSLHVGRCNVLANKILEWLEEGRPPFTPRA